MNLIQLQDDMGKDVYLNPEHVIAVHPYGQQSEKSYVVTSGRATNGGNVSVVIAMSASDLAALLKQG